MSFAEVIGVAGAAVLLIAFALEEFEVIRETSYTYNGLNILGSVLMGWYALLLHSTPFIVLETAWALIAIWYISKRLARRAKSS